MLDPHATDDAQLRTLDGRDGYSLCPSNLRMMVSMNVFCGAT